MKPSMVNRFLRCSNRLLPQIRHSSSKLSSLLDTSSDKTLVIDRSIKRKHERTDRTRKDYSNAKKAPKFAEHARFRYPPSHDVRSSKKETIEPIFDADISSVILFPGQGSQFTGMGKKLLELPKVSDIYMAANEILGYDLLRLCLNGPQQDLDKTQHCQPAVFVTSLAALEMLKVIDPEAIEQCIATAGFSVGEYAALVFAGMIKFEDALKLLKLRAEAMQRCSEQQASGLLTVQVQANSQLGEAVKAALENAADSIDKPTCSIAIDLFTGCKVIGGHEACLKYIERHGKHFGVRPLKRVRVSGAFHTQLMGDAARELYSAAGRVPLSAPKIPVVANYDSHPYDPDPTKIRAFQSNLSRQLTTRVKWESTMAQLFNAGRHYFIEGKIPKVYEVGPGGQLKTIINKFNHNVAIKMQSVPV